MMMGGSSILLLVVLAVAVWALIKVFPDWQDRVGLIIIVGARSRLRRP
jgi:hypothetical protein